MTMTIREAIIQSLDDIKSLANYQDIYKHILEKRYVVFNKDAKTPDATISAALSNFITKGDSRVKRVKKAGRVYSYYLTKHEQLIGTDILNQEAVATVGKPTTKAKGYGERDLHKLLSSYLKSTDIYSKTIFHETSNGKDRNQIWMHPDMVGIKFLKQDKTTQNFMKAINQVDTFKLSSYEIKREITNDNDLKAAFFQAVSNSSWANYGYLVAFEFGDTLIEEIERLNQAFGIGVIQLYANTYRSRVLFQPKYRAIDFKTMDKLCRMNKKEFDKFIEHIEKLMTATEKYFDDAEKGFDDFCDPYFKNDTEMKNYCIDNDIPWDNEEE